MAGGSVPGVPSVRAGSGDRQRGRAEVAGTGSGGRKPCRKRSCQEEAEGTGRGVQAAGDRKGTGGGAGSGAGSGPSSPAPRRLTADGEGRNRD